MPKNILLTGSNGFIGKNLKSFLEGNGFSVAAPASRNYDFTDFATVQRLISDYRPSAIILAGFYGINNPDDIPHDIAEKNIKIFRNFAQALGGEKPIITFGSGAEFDKSKPIEKALEANLGKNIPQDLYGAAKYQLSQEIKKHPNAINLRLFGVYGPYERETRFITYAIRQNLARKPIEIRQNVKFDYLYIADLCEIVLAFLKNRPAEQFINLTPTQSIDLLKISEIINKTSGFESPVSALKPGFNNEYTGSNALLLKELPGFKFTTYTEGIKKLFNFLKDKPA